MTVKDLIDRLSVLDPDAEIMILDGSNGAGVPREINFGPVTRKITSYHLEACADVEHLDEGSEVYTLGYGCY